MALHLSPNFSIKTFTIHTVEGASCVNIGNNEPSGFRNYKKHNQGFGTVTGNNNNFDGLKTLLNDKALLDLLSGVNQEELHLFKEILTEKLLEELYEEDEEPDWGEEEAKEIWDEAAPIEIPSSNSKLKMKKQEVVFDNINLLDDEFDEVAGDD